MELRTTEERLDELVRMYESLRQSPLWWTTTSSSSSSMSSLCPLPPLPTHLQRQPPPPPPPLQRLDTGNGLFPPSTTTPTTLPVEDVATAVQTLERMQTLLKGGPPSPHDSTTTTTTTTTAATTVYSLPTSMEKFHKRRQDVDPITLQPRYGLQTMGRVQWAVETYDFLKGQILGGEEDDKEDGGGVGDPTAITGSASMFLQQWQDQYQQQLKKEREEQIRQEQEGVRREEEQRVQRLRQQQEEQAALQAERDREQERQEQERAQLRTQAEQARQRRLAHERAEHEWFESIVKGVEGVRRQLAVLQTSTKDHDDSSKRVYKTAIQSLYTLFQQINAHPEETKFRRIRRDHEQFQADIGRYKGGVELLIAAGFTLGAIDDVPCYISKEPDLENDMDGWAAWFDVLKGTLQVLEDEMMKTSEIPSIR